jgi:hypothetical protein
MWAYHRGHEGRVRAVKIAFLAFGTVVIRIVVISLQIRQFVEGKTEKGHTLEWHRRRHGVDLLPQLQNSFLLRLETLFGDFQVLFICGR